METKNSTKRREMEHRRMLIARLFHQGHRTQQEIADRLRENYGVSIHRSTISRDLHEIEKRWIASAQVDIDAAKGEIVAEIINLQRENWTAWARSCEDAETIRQEGSRKDKGDEDRSSELPPVDKIVKTSKGQAGDPRFLQGVQWCIDRRCKILGVDAAQKLDLGGAVKFDLDEWKHRREERQEEWAGIEEQECASQDT